TRSQPAGRCRLRTYSGSRHSTCVRAMGCAERCRFRSVALPGEREAVRNQLTFRSRWPDSPQPQPTAFQALDRTRGPTVLFGDVPVSAQAVEHRFMCSPTVAVRTPAGDRLEAGIQRVE